MFHHTKIATLVEHMRYHDQGLTTLTETIVKLSDEEIVIVSWDSNKGDVEAVQQKKSDGEIVGRLTINVRS